MLYVISCYDVSYRIIFKSPGLAEELHRGGEDVQQAQGIGAYNSNNSNNTNNHNKNNNDNNNSNNNDNDNDNNTRNK